jgi:hypothetical protein
MVVTLITHDRQRPAFCKRNFVFGTVLRIRDVYPGSRIRLFSIPDPESRIPDPNCLHPGSRICIKEFKYFSPKKTNKWFLSSRKYDPGCSSPIPDPDADFLPIPDPGSRIPDPGVNKAPDPGSGSATLLW